MLPFLDRAQGSHVEEIVARSVWHTYRHEPGDGVRSPFLKRAVDGGSLSDAIGPQYEPVNPSA